MAAPNEAHIREFVEDRQQAYGKQREQIEYIRTLRYREHDVHVPNAYRTSTTIVKSPVIADVESRVVATLTKEYPVISVPPYADTDKAKANSSLRERWSQAAMRQMERDANRPVFRMGIDGAVADSLRIWKLVDNKESWKNYPRRRKDEEAGAYLERGDKFVKGQPFPFSWTDLDPLSYLPDRLSGLPTEVAEVTERALIPAMEEFGVRLNSGNSSQRFVKARAGEPVSAGESTASKTIKCVEHWYMSGDNRTATVSYLLDGEMVDRRELTSYPRVPYFLIGGHMTSSRKPEHQYASVVQPFAHLVPALDTMLSMAMNRIYLFGYPFMRRRSANGKSTVIGPENPVGVTEINPGDLLEDIEFMGEIGPSTVIKDMVNLFMQMMDRSGLSPIMYGGGGGATPSSGYLAGQLLTAAQLVFGPIIDNAIMALEQMIPFMWQLIERRPTLKRKVYVWGAGGKGVGEWLGLGPEDIDGYYACQVKLKPLLPMDKFAERQSAIQMKEAGLWSDEEALSQIGEEQPEQVLLNVTARKVATSEMVMGEIVKRVMAKKFPPPPPAPPAEGPNGQPLNQSQEPQPGGMPMPGGMPGGGQFMPPLQDLTRPPQMGAQVPNPLPPPQGQ